eukprot:216453-Amphidinium_carterae.1
MARPTVLFVHVHHACRLGKPLCLARWVGAMKIAIRLCGDGFQLHLLTKDAVSSELQGGNLINRLQVFPRLVDVEHTLPHFSRWRCAGDLCGYDSVTAVTVEQFIVEGRRPEPLRSCSSGASAPAL